MSLPVRFEFIASSHTVYIFSKFVCLLKRLQRLKQEWKKSPSVTRAGIFKPLWSPGIDAKASTPPAYVAWRAGAITLFLVGA
jgi:hypothetical protein